jgi:probable rRNA maturation factor
VHGALHAQGWDHESAREAQAMEAHESELLLALGFGDPYRRQGRFQARNRRAASSAK